ncbi:MAG TPA: High-affinity nickel transporter [Thermoanaerobaculia bacterium]|nr:High-affinity nickel transporter [Thermoanaerobaculia bacterium]
MPAPFSFAMIGLLAGLVHALSGPDHLSAVAPLVVQERRRGWTTGLLWGMGHSVGVWVVGLLALALRGLLPINRLSSISERMVGAVLIAVGLWGLRRVWLARYPAEGAADETPHHHHLPARPSLAALWIGTLHGLAGSSHLLGILPALALPSLSASVAYVIAFGLGSIAAMVAFSSVLGLVAVRLTVRGPGAYQVLLGTFSAVSIAVGGWWLIW